MSISVWMIIMKRNLVALNLNTIQNKLKILLAMIVSEQVSTKYK